MKQLYTALLLLFATQASALSVHFQVYSETCNGNDGAIIAEVSGGEAPYTFLWSNGSTAPTIANLPAATYYLTVTDNLGATMDVQCMVMQLSLWDMSTSLVGTEGLQACAGQCNGGFRLHLPRIIGGYSFNTTPSMTYAELPEDEGPEVDLFITYEFLGACAGTTVQIDASPQNGCTPGSAAIPIEEQQMPSMVVQEITASCTVEHQGTVTVEVTAPSIWGIWEIQAVDGAGGSSTPEPSNIVEAGTETYMMTGMHPGDWTIQVSTVYSMGSLQAACYTTQQVVIPDLGADCGMLSGTLHFETDVDCVQDGGEVGIPYQMLRVLPGPLYAITAQDGSYSVGVPYGSYDLEQLGTDFVQLCPPAAPVPFTLSAVQQTAVVDLADSAVTSFDMSATVWNAPSRLGLPFTYTVNVLNNNGYPGQDVTVVVTYDQLFTYVSASPGLVVNTPGQAEWTIPALLPFGQATFTLTLQVPADVLLIGTNHTASVQVSSTTSETNLTNNTHAITHNILAAYDPNDKTAFTSTGTSDAHYFLDIDEYIDYLIRFQNTGNDTAFTVMIADTLGPLLDVASLQVLGASHAFTPSMHGGNVVHFTFNDILLPDSTTNESASHGFVAFRIKPVDGLLIGETIANAADIFFDINPPVRTNTSELITEITVGMDAVTIPLLGLSPVPATDHLLLRTDGQALTGIAIMALDGRAVAHFGGSTTVDVSTLSPGVYVLRALTNKGTVLQARFVKQ